MMIEFCFGYASNYCIIVTSTHMAHRESIHGAGVSVCVSRFFWLVSSLLNC